MPRYKALAEKKYYTADRKISTESRYWTKFQRQVDKYDANCNSLCYSPASPFDLAVTVGSELILRSGVDGKFLRSLNRLKKIACCAQYRHDGKLIAGGDAEGNVVIMDSRNKAVLRAIAGHGAAVHSVSWCVDGLLFGSASDDKLVKLWDLGSGEQIKTFYGHSDYIRTVEYSPNDSNILLSAGYDGFICLWDKRQDSCVLKLPYSFPVKAAIFLPNNSKIVAAGSNGLKIWDFTHGSKELSSHSIGRSITCLAIDATKTRLVAGGMDSSINIHSLENLEVVHSIATEKSVLHVALSACGNQYAFASTTGLLCISKRKKIEDKTDLIANNSRKIKHSLIAKSEPEKKRTTISLSLNGTRKYTDHDNCLKNFRYRDALDSAIATKNSALICSVIEELIQRRGLFIACGGRSSETLQPIMEFLFKKISETKYASLCIRVAQVLTEIYKPHFSDINIKSLFFKLQEKIERHTQLQADLIRLKGAIDSVLLVSASIKHI